MVYVGTVESNTIFVCMLSNPPQVIVFVHKPLLTCCVMAVSPLKTHRLAQIPFTGPSPSSQLHLPPSCPFMLCRRPFLSWLRSWLIGPNLTDRRGNDRLSNSNSQNLFHILFYYYFLSVCLSLLLTTSHCCYVWSLYSFSICQSFLKLQPQALLQMSSVKVSVDY